MSGMRRVGLLVAAAGLAAGILAGCSSGDEGATSGAAGRAGVPAAEQPGQDALVQSRDQAGKPADRQVAAGQLALKQRKLARTASMTVRAKRVDEATADARAIAAEAGGYTGSERSHERSATLTLTVPAEKLDQVLDELEKLGKRVDREVSVQDVTDTVVDVDSRVASQRRSLARARALFDQAESISDIVSVEQELAGREAELESLLARQQALQGQVAMAPITLTLVQRERAAETDDDPGGFLAGLSGGWRAFTLALSAAATVLGAVAPFVVFIGVPAGGLYWALRRRRRKAVDPAAA